MVLDESFWDNRYKEQNTGWDVGEITTPLKTYFDQLTNKALKILIPGGGNSYEAEYLHKLGFKNIFVVDLSATALQNIQKRVPSFPKNNLIQANFFDLKMKFDLIIEQTFFCAIDKSLRPSYASQTFNLLSKKGKLVGVLFAAKLNNEHPPFGGNKEEYLSYFKQYFTIEIMDTCYNSIPQRVKTELFIKMKKKAS